jgi:hypothetical protein
MADFYSRFRAERRTQGPDAAETVSKTFGEGGEACGTKETTQAPAIRTPACTPETLMFELSYSTSGPEARCSRPELVSAGPLQLKTSPLVLVPVRIPPIPRRPAQRPAALLEKTA